MKVLIILIEYCAGSTTSKYSWKSCGGSRVRQGNLARHAESVWAQHADASPLSRSDYDFLLERFVDRATLHRAEALAKKWGVLPHAVMIANGWLSASDYYRALAETCGVPFRVEIGPDEVTAPPSLRGPRKCLARGLLKERGRGGVYVFAPQKLRPSAVEVVLARLAPHRLSLASPDTLRQVICGHFAQTFAAAQPSPVDAVLLAADLRRGLSRRLAVRDRPLHLGKDRARAWSRHDTCRDAFASRDAPPRSRQKQALRAGAR